MQTVSSRVLSSGASGTLEILPDRPDRHLYYVYASGALADVCAWPNEAVVKADELLGLVVDEEQNYIWVRGDRQTRAELQVEDLPAAVTAGTTDPDQLQEGIEQRVLDVSGCTWTRCCTCQPRKPVIAQTLQGPVIIVGYDEFNVFLLDPGTTEWYYGGLNDSTAMFEEAGNVFLTYMPE